jgi:hypothetical protein
MSSLLNKARPRRPEPIGEFVAHFPLKEETVVVKETKDEFAERWNGYLRNMTKFVEKKSRDRWRRQNNRPSPRPSHKFRRRVKYRVDWKSLPRSRRSSNMAVESSISGQKRGFVNEDK